MERFQTGLLILVIILVITCPASIFTPNLAHKYVLDVSEYENQFNTHLAQGYEVLSFTWISTGISYPQEVTNNSIIIGDHIVLNATFENDILGVNVTSSELLFVFESGNITRKSADSPTIVVDTYYLHRMNNTYDISVIGYTDTNESIAFDWENITLCNFFIPKLNSLTIVELPEDQRTLNISWLCIDQNHGEINLFEILISNNGGLTFLYLTRNRTAYWYAWNTTGFLETFYWIKIRAYSHDISSASSPIIRVPDDYWPGDFSDELSEIYAGWPRPPGPPFPLPNFNCSSDIEYVVGSVGNVIIWEVSYNSAFHYDIQRNGSIVLSENWTEGSIVVSIDGLQVGTYEYSLIVFYYTLDRVLVTVRPNENLYTSYLLQIIAVSSAILIIVSVAMIIQHQRKVAVID